MGILSGAVEEEFWCLPVLRQGVEIARAGIEEGIGGGGGGRKDDCVDD